MAEQPPAARGRRNQLPSEKLALLEERIERALGASSGKGGIPRGSQQDILPLSYAQEGLWALSLIDPEHAASNNPILLRLKGGIDLSAMNRAFSALLHRQEALCCRMRSDLGSPSAQLSPVAEYELPVVDFSRLPERAARSAADEWIRAEIEAPVSIFESPLLRAHLLRLLEDEHHLLMVFHHIAMDGWSKGIALWELGRFYSAAVEGKAADLPVLSIRYSDFAAWQRARLGSPEIQPLMEFWKSRLRELPPPFEIPVDHRRQMAISSPAGTLRFSIESALVSSLRQLGAEYGATLAMTLLAGYLILLKRFSGQTDLVIGLPVAGRTEPQTENLIGLFINTLVFRCNLSGKPGFLDVLEAVRAEAEQVYSHQEIPLEKLVSDIPHKRDPARPPFFQILFNFKNLPAREIRFSGLEAEILSTRASGVRYDLSLEMEKEGDSIQASFNYNAALYDEATIVKLVESFQNLLEGIVKNPRLDIASLSLSR